MPPRVTVIEVHDTMMLFEMIRQRQTALVTVSNAAEAIQHIKMIRLFMGGIELHMWELRQ